jgi:hypothetical protein
MGRAVRFAQIPAGVFWLHYQEALAEFLQVDGAFSGWAVSKAASVMWKVYQAIHGQRERRCGKLRVRA